MGKFGIEIKPEAARDLKKHYQSGDKATIRRLNKKDRMVYSVVQEIVTVTIVSAMGHYRDK